MKNYRSLQDKYPNIIMKFDQPLSLYSYTKTGGKADVIVFPESREEVQAILQWVEEEQAPLTIFGNLSNLIVRDGGIDGVVMILTRMAKVEADDHGIYAESGASIIETSRHALSQSMTGLEFACGIPGSVGGAVYMNAGAYDGEVVDCIEYVDILTLDGKLQRLSNEESQFSYRHSIYQENEAVILGAYFKLQKGNVDEIEAEMERLTELRQSKQPLEYPSCGSVFKRPEGYFTGKLIQDAGLQGHRIGGAEVSKKHAGFIVNVDHATATDYTQMIEYIQREIKDRYGVTLETEVRILGRD